MTQHVVSMGRVQAKRLTVWVICITCVSHYKMHTSAPWWATMPGNPAVQDVTFSMFYPWHNAMPHTQGLLTFTAAQYNQCFTSAGTPGWPNCTRACSSMFHFIWGKSGQRKCTNQINPVWTHEISQWLTAYECLTDWIQNPPFFSWPLFSILLLFHN